jgi:hypothetical protein
MQLCVCGDASKGPKEDANKNSSLFSIRWKNTRTASCAASCAIEGTTRKRSKEAISDIGSNHYISDHFLKESS